MAWLGTLPLLPLLLERSEESSCVSLDGVVIVGTGRTARGDLKIEIKSVKRSQDYAIKAKKTVN